VDCVRNNGISGPENAFKIRQGVEYTFRLCVSYLLIALFLLTRMRSCGLFHLGNNHDVMYVSVPMARSPQQGHTVVRYEEIREQSLYLEGDSALVSQCSCGFISHFVRYTFAFDIEIHQTVTCLFLSIR
jgi:hypothetical protein